MKTKRIKKLNTLCGYFMISNFFYVHKKNFMHIHAYSEIYSQGVKTGRTLYIQHEIFYLYVYAILTINTHCLWML